MAALAALAVVLIAAGAWIVLRVKNNPESRERRRRLLLNRTGRRGDATITEASDVSIFYSYSIGGVAYNASQDIATLLSYLPAEHSRLIGHAFIKYAPRNAANSIVLCEEWSGIREPVVRPHAEPEPDQTTP